MHIEKVNLSSEQQLVTMERDSNSDTNLPKKIKRIKFYSSSSRLFTETGKKKRTVQNRKRRSEWIFQSDHSNLDEDPLISEMSKNKKATVSCLHNDHKLGASASERAAEFQADLEDGFPSFTKTLVPSNISSHGSAMKLPKQFCRSHLPNHDAKIILINECGEEYTTSYLARPSALCGGWKGYAKEHKLVVGDALVFQLVGPFRFKVYTVRAASFSEVDAAVAILQLNPCSKQKDLLHEEPKILKPLPVSTDYETIQMSNQLASNCISGPLMYQSENGSGNISSDISEGTLSIEQNVDFTEVKSIESFSILVNGLNINSELSSSQRSKYYELCCSQKSYLHDHLLKTINRRLAVEIIAETVNIAEAISGKCPLTSRTCYLNWEKTLEAFELLGMNVAFLRVQMKRKTRPAFNSSKEVSHALQIRNKYAYNDSSMEDIERQVLMFKEVV